MRIEGGEKKGFIIKVPKNIRPTTSFIKKSIFDTIGNFILNKDVLELFAGSGALGFEALSRGAKSCIFVDISRSSQKAIEENIKKLGYENKASFIKSDAIKFLRNYSMSFDIILADPPYDYENYDELLNYGYLRIKENGIFVLQLSSKKSLKLNSFSVYKDYVRGETRVLYLEVKKF